MAVYLDHNASNLIDSRLLDHYCSVLASHQGNPGSPHGAGRQARALIETAREELAETFGYDIADITFCSSGTEALNLFIQKALPWQAGDQILYSATEHKAVTETVKDLALRQGIIATSIPVDQDGLVEIEALKALLTPQSRLCIVMAANNEVGTVQPLQEIQAALPESVTFLVDAVQGGGRLPLESLCGDAMVVSSHKMRAPKGAAALMTKPGFALGALLHGGSQERGRRAGTEDTAAISTLGLAARLARQGELFDRAELLARRERFEDALLKACPQLTINGAGAPRLPQTTSLFVPGWTSEKLITLLDLHGFHVSSGSACTSGSLLPSHVLVAMGQSEDQARSALRVSFGPESTDEDLSRFAQTLSQIINK